MRIIWVRGENSRVVKATIENNHGQREEVTRSRKLHPRKVKEEHRRIYQAFTKGQVLARPKLIGTPRRRLNLVCREIFSTRGSEIKKKKNTAEKARAKAGVAGLIF